MRRLGTDQIAGIGAKLGGTVGQFYRVALRVAGLVQQIGAIAAFLGLADQVARPVTDGRILRHGWHGHDQERQD